MCLFGSQVSLFLMAESLLMSPGQLQSNKLITSHVEIMNPAAVAPKIPYLLQSVCLLGEKETFLTELPLLVSFPPKRQTNYKIFRKCWAIHCCPMKQNLWMQKNKFKK